MFSFLSRPTAGTPSIDVVELDSLLSSDAVRVLDVCEDHEFKSGHVPGAIHVPVKRLLSSEECRPNSPFA